MTGNSDVERPLTPDFYDYPWTPPSDVVVDGDFLSIRWADGAELVAYKQWLRENEVGGGGVDVATREGLIDPAHIDDTLQIREARIDATGVVEVHWYPDDVLGRYHPGWLRHIADGSHRPESWLSDPVAWTSAELAEPPTHPADALESALPRLALVQDLMRYGFVRLRGCPTDSDHLAKLAGHFGPLRDTNFGRVWDVKADIDPTSTANTGLRLGPHTDLPTREAPPGFQMLHCVINSTSGGYSEMADGLAVANRLRAMDPDAHDILTTRRWIFFNRGAEIDHRWSGPLIDHGVPGSPLTFRAFYPVRAFPDMPADDVPKAYAAMRQFSHIAASPEFQVASRFEPGDVVMFDNRRVLHGRGAYDPSAGSRHLRGCYLDHDDVRSTARVWARRATIPPAGAAANVI